MGLFIWLNIPGPQALKLSKQLKTGNLPFQGAETLSKFLRNLLVHPRIDKHDLRRWPVIHIPISKVSGIDPVVFQANN